MVKFDLQTAQSLAGSIGGGGQSILGAIEVEFGIPSCMMDLGKDLLSLLPTNVLGGIRNDMAVGRNAADAVTKGLSQKLRNLTGILEFDTDEGVFRFVSDSSQYGQESGSVAGAIGSFVSNAQQAIAFGSQLYSNVTAASGALQELVDCVGSFGDFLENLGGESAEGRAAIAATSPEDFANLIADEYGPQIESAVNANKFKVAAERKIREINEIISDRINNPDLEPKLLPSDPPEDVGSVFRLPFGPPLAKSGQFLLSVDGLYYDSQTSGVAPALLELDVRQAERDPSLDWKLEFDPSLGGRGAPETLKDLDSYFNTIFDPSLIDESDPFPQYYDADNTLVNIIGQRDRKIFDVSAEIQQNIDAGSSQAVIDNLKQVMISESARFNDQANRRKKQIELAIKMPQAHGKGILFDPGEVPVNDFSYLAGINYSLDLQRQRNIVIRQDEVDGVVLPIETKFAEVIRRDDGIAFDHLIVSPFPDGLTIDSANASASVSASLAATPTLISDNLFGLYNYLTLKSVQPSSTSYLLRNSTKEGVSKNAQLVGDTNQILDKGLGLLNLNGICRTSPTGDISGVGSFARLPEAQEFQDLLYNRGGATVETWAFVPDLSSVDAYNQDSDVSGLYRLILANENTGSSSGIETQSDILNMSLNNGVGVSRGMILGFTRDRRFTQETIPSNLEADNPVRDVSLVMAPTQSFDSSSAGFISNKKLTATCESVSSWKGLVIPVSSTFNGATLSSCESEFCQISVTFNPVLDEIKVYLDGTNLVTSSYSDVFDAESRKQTPRIPSIPPENSFEYIKSNLGGNSIQEYHEGPRRDRYFTPWILGGGFTDGNPDGGFMGGEYGGKVSGLNGYLGCTRFYSKPLTDAEVLNNYNATESFFKNIKI